MPMRLFSPRNSVLFRIEALVNGVNQCFNEIIVVLVDSQKLSEITRGLFLVIVPALLVPGSFCPFCQWCLVSPISVYALGFGRMSVANVACGSSQMIHHALVLVTSDF